MKYFLIAFALIAAVACDVSHLDSATQGPNPQDIATPEPEYIDIDLPPPPSARAAAPAPPPPAPIRIAPAPIRIAPAPAPIRIAAAPAPIRPISNYLPPGRAPQPIHRPSTQYLAPAQQHHHHHHQEAAPAHTYSSNDGYRYKTIRRLKYRYRY